MPKNSLLFVVITLPIMTLFVTTSTYGYFLSTRMILHLTPTPLVVDSVEGKAEFAVLLI